MTVTDANGCVSNTASATVAVNPNPSVTITGAPTGAICAGSALNLGAAVAGGTPPFIYSWKKSGTTFATTASLSDNPSANATYTVTVTDANGCVSNTASVIVTINPLPSVTITGAPTGAICAGTAVTLGTSVTSGAAPFTYSWSKTVAATTTPLGVTTSSMSDTPSVTTTYTVTVTDANSCSTSVFVTVTVNPAPSTAITGAPSGAICAGTAVNLGTTVTGGTGPFAYTWKKNGSVLATTASISDNLSATATYTVIVTGTNGCASSTTSATVTVNPALSVTITGAPASAICAGTAINLGTTVTSGTAPFTYNWKKNGTALATTATISDTPAAGSTTYQVTATDANGCSSTTSATVNVYDFTLSVSPSDRTVLRGVSTTYTVSAALAGGSAGAPASVSLSMAGLPTDATTTGFPTSLALSTTGTSATFTLQTGATSLGDATLTVTGAAGCSKTAQANLHIFDYSVSISPSDRTVVRTCSASYAVSVNLLAGSTTTGLPGLNAVSLSLSTLSNASTTLASTVNFPQSTATPTTTTLTVATAGTTNLGDFTLSVTGAATGGSRGGSAGLHLYDYTVSVATPSDMTILRGTSTSYTVNVNLAPGSSTTNLSSISLSQTGLPGDATLGFSPAAGVAPFTSTLNVTTVNTSLDLGDFAFTVTGSTDCASRTGSATLRVFDFTISASAGGLTLRGCTATYAMTIATATGSTTTNVPSIALSVTGLGGSAGTFSPSSITLAAPGASTTASLSVNTAGGSVGDFTFTVNGAAGGGTRTGTGALHVWDYSVSLSPASKAMAMGQAASYGINVPLVSGSSTFGGLPTIMLGFSASPILTTVTPPSINPSSAVPGSFSASASLSINTSSSTSPGTYTLTLSSSSNTTNPALCQSRPATTQLLVSPITVQEFVTDSSFNPIPGNSLDVVFTRDNNATCTISSPMKMPATNPGDEYLILQATRVNSSVNSITLTVNMPGGQDSSGNPVLPAFLLKGSMPVQAFDAFPPPVANSLNATVTGYQLTVCNDPSGYACLSTSLFPTPAGALQPLSTNYTRARTIQLTVPFPASNTVVVALHIDYALRVETPTCWPAGSDVSFFQGYLFDTAVAYSNGTASTSLTNDIQTPFQATGKNATGIAGFAQTSATPPAGKAGLVVTISPTPLPAQPATFPALVNGKPITNSSGFYIAALTPSVVYTVTLQNASGATVPAQPSGSSTFTLAPGEFRQLDFTAINPADPVVHGWAVSNGSGVAGATVQLIQAASRRTIATTTTDAGGYYSFALYQPGTFVVSITPPSGYTTSAASQTVTTQPFQIVLVNFTLSQ